jgi:hypothetical protein
MASVQLKLGDMFDGPSDLIVLPCSTLGAVTQFVHDKLVHHHIPYPGRVMKLGDVSIIPFEGGQNIAQYVAYAASVEDNDSSEPAIRRIGERIGAATNEGTTIRRVSAPLLGSGAGGLPGDTVVRALSEGFKSQANRDARLVIHVLDRDRDIYERLSKTDAKKQSGDTAGLPSASAPRVFISYSRSSPEHQQWVEQLATFLRENGIDARLDVWHLRLGMDLPQFMTNELTLAERVILVSDAKFAEKADGRVGGVGWETMIVQGDMARQPPESTKYLVIVRDNDVEHGLPKYLRTKFVIHWPDHRTDDRNRHILLRELFDAIKIPALGPKPVFL